MKKIITITILSLPLFSFDYMPNCTVPNVLIKTIQITENKKSYPYFIRTNEKTEKFKDIIERFTYNKTKDERLIDCINKENCITITNTLIKNKITNLDLGLHQINYNSYPKEIYKYFDKLESFKSACEVVEDKIKFLKNWNWEILASYHSVTPALNEKYKNKLIENYITLTTNE